MEIFHGLALEPDPTNHPGGFQLAGPKSKAMIYFPIPELVGGWTTHLENMQKSNGKIFPNFRGEHKKCWKNHHLVNYCWWKKSG